MKGKSKEISDKLQHSQPSVYVKENAMPCMYPGRDAFLEKTEETLSF